MKLINSKNIGLVASWGLAATALLVVIFLVKNPFAAKPVGTLFKGTINKFCINDFCLEKKNDSWELVLGTVVLPADQELADTFSKRFTDIKLAELVSNNPDRFAELGIGTSSMTVLSIDNVKLEIGKIDSNYDGTYVRVQGEDKIYDIKVTLDSTVMRNFDYWQRKYITKLPVDQVRSVTLAHVNNKKEFTPLNSKWNDEAWINKLANLTTLGFIGSTEVANDLYQITIKLDNDYQIIDLGVDMRDPSKYKYFASTDSSHYWEISKPDFSLLTGKIY
jgi:hypothetical protein